MSKLVELLIDSAQIIDEKIIKIDHLINHNVNVEILNKVAIDMASQLHGLDIDRIVTVETGGIAIATLLSIHLGSVDVVYAKKGANLLSKDNVYKSTVSSYTRGKEFDLTIDKRFLNEGEKVIFVDDFLATGSAYYAINDICKQAKVDIIKSFYIFNKTFQNDLNDNIYSVVKVKSLKNNVITVEEE